MAPRTQTYPYDPAQDLKDTEEQAELLREAFESGEAAFIAHALGTVARARGMSHVAQKTGVTRMGLYKSLNQQGDPKLSTVMRLLKTFDFGLTRRPEGLAGAKRVGTTSKKKASSRSAKTA